MDSGGQHDEIEIGASKPLGQAAPDWRVARRFADAKESARAETATMLMSMMVCNLNGYIL